MSAALAEAGALREQGAGGGSPQPRAPAEGRPTALVGADGGWMGGRPDDNAVSGVHTLITGLNGHGKTLMLVSDKLLPLVGARLAVGRGQTVPRRIVCHGIPGLALPHEVMDCPEVDPEKFVDEWREHVREPGSPPLDVHWQVQNWWLWAMPGDVLVIDEAQGAFPAMASGRRIPTYIKRLNVARHYGVQFIYLTQFPAMLHPNLRALVGPHEDVRRIFGGVRTVVYQWDRVSPSLNIRTATKRVWKHDRRAFGLYRSAAAHTNFRQRLPLAVFGVVGGLVAVLALGWVLYGRIWGDQSPAARSAREAEARKTGEQAAVATGGGPWAGQGGATGAVRARPLAVAAPVRDREPYAGVGLHIAGSWAVAGAQRTLFTASIDGRTVGTISDRDLQRAGYAWRTNGAPCAGVLIFGSRERAVTCDAPAALAVGPTSAGNAAPVASAPGG